MPTLVLLGSPFLGAAPWEPVADLLRAAGRRVVVPLPGAGVRTPADVLDGWRPALPGDLGPVVLVPHSNAGLYVAALAADPAVADVVRLVFVDAALPSPDPLTATAPAGLRDQVTALADGEGLLPPWARWWPTADAAELFPDEPTRARVEAEQPRLPAGYLAAQVPTPSGWEKLPAAYLGFGDTYADEQAEARRRGWPVETLPGRHLHQLVDPEAVAAAVARLTDDD